ncbi:MAG TPA: adenylate/guanylate cyclase domain-containing protein [Chloroflexi bacterium]|nr:adenylate/guanylate cyclase domain-containing protein [Chloroflexota bacterium]
MKDRITQTFISSRDSLTALEEGLKSLAAGLTQQRATLEHFGTARPGTPLARLQSAVVLMEQLLPQMEKALRRLQKAVDEQEREREELEALFHVSSIVNSTLDLSEVLNYVMDQIIELTGAERSFLMLINEETGTMEFKVARNMDRETISGSSFEISRTIVHKVAQEGEPIVTTNAQMDPRFSAQESVVSYSLRSILCVPLKVKDKITGVIYADNRIKAGLFTDRDRDLLAAFANQAAVAIENARLFESVANAKRLMDNIFASITSGVITTDVQDQITLFNRAAERILKLSAGKAIGRPLPAVLPPPLQPVLVPIVRRVREREEFVIAQEFEPEVPGRGQVNLSITASPLKDANDETQGVAIVVDDLTERRRLEAKERFIRETFKRYVAPAVVERLIEDPDSLKLGGRRQEITIFFADIRGFTSFSERHDPETLVEILNKYLAIGAEAVLQEEGTLDKFMGDAVMAFFNAPLPQPDHTLRAVRAALAMRERIRAHHETVEPQYRLSYGVGINVGEAVVGNVGTAQQLNYTAIGDAVNLAKRLQENARPNQILLSHAAYERVKDYVEVKVLPPIRVKGRQATEQLYELIGLREGESSDLMIT